MASDKQGNAVGYGDWVAVEGSPQMGLDGALIVRITKIEESPKGIKATGAYVDLVGNGRIGKVPVDIAAATLVMRANGEVMT